MNKISNFNVERQKAEESIDDWIFGALSQPGVVSIPEAERENYLPRGEEQFDQFVDFNDCASRSPVNHAEALFSYHYDHGMKPENKKWMEDNGYIQDGKVTFSDRYISILSGTTHQGNSLKSPLQAIHSQGLIPKKLLPKEDWMKWEDYYDASKITSTLKNLGQEFLKRFPINYELVALTHFPDVLKDDCIGVAAYAWPIPVNGVYPKTDGTFNHAFLLYDLPKYQAFDNYREYNPVTGVMDTGDFTKSLDPEYIFYPSGYRVYVSAENIVQTTEQSNIISQVFDALKKNGLLNYFADWLNRFLNPMVPQSINSTKLLDTALSFVGKDASPNDLAPDEYGCAETMNEIHKAAFGNYISPSNPLSTYYMYRALKVDRTFAVTSAPEKGCLIISPTGYGSRRNPDGSLVIPSGHVGIVGDNNLVYSNDSKTGTFKQNYTIETWLNRFVVQGGYLTAYFKKL